MLAAQSQLPISEFVRPTSSANSINNNNHHHHQHHHQQHSSLNSNHNNHSKPRTNSTYHHQPPPPPPTTTLTTSTTSTSTPSPTSINSSSHHTFPHSHQSHISSNSSQFKSNHSSSPNHQSLSNIIPHSHPSNLSHPFPAPHLMISPQPYSFNPHSLSPQLAIFNPLIFHPNQQQQQHQQQHHFQQADQLSPAFSRRSSSASHNSSPPAHSELLNNLSHHHHHHHQTNKLQSNSVYPQPLYSQAHSHRGSNSSLPTSHQSRASLGSGSNNSRPSSIHIATRPRTDSTQSDRTPALTNSHRLRRDSPTHSPSATNPSPRASPRLQPHDPHSQISRSPTPTKSNAPLTSNSGTNLTSSIPTSNLHTLTHPTRPTAMVRKPSPLAQGTRSPAPPPGASPAAVPAPSSPALVENRVEPASEENSEETASEPDQGLGQTTPSTSVDSTVSATSTTLPNSNPTINPPTTLKPKPKLGFKLRRALSIGALHDNMIQSSIPESEPAQAISTGRSTPIATDSLATPKAPKSTGISKRFGILNGRANSSTDNLSISSTVSSASVMIRKLGNLGRTARRNSVMGLTKIFKDKKENGNEEIGEEEEVKKVKKTNGNESMKVVEEESFEGLTPAAAFILRQKQEYAEREAAAAVAKPRVNPLNGSSSKKIDKSTSVLLNNHAEGSDPNESRKKMIEKEKEKLKNKWKWGSNFGGNSSQPNPSTSVPNPPNLDSIDDDDETLRGKEILKEEEEEEGEKREEEEEDLDEYDADSLFGNSVSLPLKEAVPKKGILKSLNVEPIKNRRATFAQNLSVHSTWPPAIYDRRGGPATCNRLTPSLAQRIKEELNAFKMDEMEVHHSSRVHTHFFV